MKYLIHDGKKPLKICDSQRQSIDFKLETSIAKTLITLAKAFPDALLIWCDEAYFDAVNHTELPTIFHHNYIMASYAVSKKPYISDSIGYVEQSVFLKVNYEVTYPTWLMSSDVGGISAAFLSGVSNAIHPDENFNYFINSLAKLAMPKGVFCYSAPNLLKHSVALKTEAFQASNALMFKFVKQHYKWFWTLVLFVSFIIYEGKWPVVSFFKSIIYKRKTLDLPVVDVKTNLDTTVDRRMDVIIPTIGRASYLGDVIKDLAAQSLLPIHVIIVEQNPEPDSTTALDFILEASWPFQIKHIFTHQTGACHARNLALDLVESPWVFLNDDDNRFGSDLLETVFNKFEQYGIASLITLYIQENERLQFPFIHQTGIFGSGNSFVKTSVLKDVRFSKALEFGYGEDFDFGMQLRNKGVDVIYFPDIKITHLKAPTGGFRLPVKHVWDSEAIPPKPSPTIMYNYLRHYTHQQLLSYKFVLFLKLLKKTPFLAYRTYVKRFKAAWNASVFWANTLEE